MPAKKKSAAKTSATKARRAKSKTNGRAKAPEDAIALLKADHRSVEALFEEFESAKGVTAKQRIAQQICLELIVHAEVEEEVFYPGVKDAVEEDIYTEAHVEHDGAKVLIAEILAGDPDGEYYDARVKVLSEMIKHHVHEEEMRDGMFAQARKGDVDLEALGDEIARRKEDLMRLYKRNGPPRPKTRTMQQPPQIDISRPVS